jgi:hypothetical protein
MPDTALHVVVDMGVPVTQPAIGPTFTVCKLLNIQSGAKNSCRQWIQKSYEFRIYKKTNTRKADTKYLIDQQR